MYHLLDICLFTVKFIEKMLFLLSQMKQSQEQQQEIMDIYWSTSYVLTY